MPHNRIRTFESQGDGARGDLSSTGYVLAYPGREYLVLDPGQRTDSFTVTLEAATYTIQWYRMNSREIVGAEKVTVENSTTISFRAPFVTPGPAVLYLKASAQEES